MSMGSSFSSRLRSRARRRFTTSFGPQIVALDVGEDRTERLRIRARFARLLEDQLGRLDIVENGAERPVRDFVRDGRGQLAGQRQAGVVRDFGAQGVRRAMADCRVDRR